MSYSNPRAYLYQDKVTTDLVQVLERLGVLKALQVRKEC